MARFFRVGLSLQEGRRDGSNWAAVAGAPAAAATDAAARHWAGGAASADGAAERPRLHGPADCGDLRGGRGRGAGVAASLSGAGARRAGGPSAAGQAAAGPPGPARRRGLVQACWTVGLLTSFLRARCWLVLSASSVRRYVHASGWRWARPRLDVATH